MKFKMNLKNVLLVLFAAFALSACATQKKSGNMEGDVYTGTETVKFLAKVFRTESSLQQINLL